MQQPLMNVECFEAQYYAEIIRNECMNDLGEWHEDCAPEMYLPPFPEWTVLHSFSAYIIGRLVDELDDDPSVDEIKNDETCELWFDRALAYHGIENDGFRQWLKDENIQIDTITEDEIYNYHSELRMCGQMEALVTELANQVYSLLFNNRTLLAELNEYVSTVVRQIDFPDLDQEHVKLLRKHGVIAKVAIPAWVQDAVFSRDRGMCGKCNSDLSEAVGIGDPVHYKHIIPLDAGGINDVTNIQLLCNHCFTLPKANVVQFPTNRK